MHLTVIDGGLAEHEREIRPDPESVRSERTGGVGSLLDAAAYPLTASCASCEQPIRCAHIMADWQHVDRAVPAPRAVP